jgi:AcrR family transcriptional regulator
MPEPFDPNRSSSDLPAASDAAPAPAPPGRGQGKSDTRRRILEAARIVFARDGYLDATLEDVAGEAGVGKSTLYRHVESKAELLAQTLIEQDEDPAPRIAAALSQHDSAESQLRALAGVLATFIEENPAYRPKLWAIDNQDLIGELPPAVLHRAEESYQVELSALEEVIRRGIERGEFRRCDPRVTAHVIWNLGVLLFDLRFSHLRRRLLGSSVERFFREGLELVIQGLRRRPDGGA